MFKDSIKVDLLQSVDVSDIWWCDEAILFSVKNGKGMLTHWVFEKDEYPDFDYYSQLNLEGKPILQGRYHSCPTCAGMLATGYGIEKIHCPELSAVRDCMNSEYQGIQVSAKQIRPLLGLLDDGIYLLADMKCMPSDGQGHFFYDVPNEMTYNSISCDEYYNSQFYEATDGFPTYLYPTQSADSIQEQRVEEYIEMLKQCDSTPRALAYYEKGFLCALLDGHHKACAAAVLGKKLHCLTIIPMTGFKYEKGVEYQEENPLISGIDFAGITVPVQKGSRQKDYQYQYGKVSIDVKAKINTYSLTGRVFPDKYLSCKYPTIESLANLIAAGVKPTEITHHQVLQWLQNRKNASAIELEETVIKLDYTINYLSECPGEEDRKIALEVARWKDDCLPKLPTKAAMKILLKYKNKETEQIMIDYLVDHKPGDECWELANSYFQDI